MSKFDAATRRIVTELLWDRQIELPGGAVTTLRRFVNDEGEYARHAEAMAQLGVVLTGPSDDARPSAERRLRKRHSAA